MNVRYRVELSQAERDELTAMLGGGKHAARKLKRAQILLAADGGRRDEEIVRTASVSLSTVGRTKRRFVEGNLERALSEEPRPGAERKLTGKEEGWSGSIASSERRPIGRKPCDDWRSRKEGLPARQDLSAYLRSMTGSASRRWSIAWSRSLRRSLIRAALGIARVARLPMPWPKSGANQLE